MPESQQVDTMDVLAKHYKNREAQALARHNTVFAQLLKFIPRHEFEALANQDH
jgi:hypothetical protein